MPGRKRKRKKKVSVKELNVFIITAVPGVKNECIRGKDPRNQYQKPEWLKTGLLFILILFFALDTGIVKTIISQWDFLEPLSAIISWIFKLALLLALVIK